MRKKIYLFFLIKRNLKYAGAVYLFIYDYEEKQFLFNHKLDLNPILDSFDLPQLNDRANLCENNMVYSRKGVSIKVLAKVDESSGNCITTFDWSVKDQFNFRGTHVKNFKKSQNYTDLRALDKEKKYFYFNQKEYLNKCAFYLDVKKDLVVDHSLIDELTKKSDATPDTSIFSSDVYSELSGDSVRFSTPNMEARNDCYGHYDYGRGVFLYKTNWFWTWGQGKTMYKNDQNQGEEEEINIAVNFGGAISHPDHLASNEDYLKLEDRIIILHPVEMVYDKLNHMNGFVFKTAEEFRDRPTQTVDLVFTSNKEYVGATNFYVVKVNFFNNFKLPYKSIFFLKYIVYYKFNY